MVGKKLFLILDLEYKEYGSNSKIKVFISDVGQYYFDVASSDVEKHRKFQDINWFSVDLLLELLMDLELENPKAHAALIGVLDRVVETDISLTFFKVASARFFDEETFMDPIERKNIGKDLVNISSNVFKELKDSYENEGSHFIEGKAKTGDDLDFDKWKKVGRGFLNTKDISKMKEFYSFFIGLQEKDLDRSKDDMYNFFHVIYTKHLVPTDDPLIQNPYFRGSLKQMLAETNDIILQEKAKIKLIIAKEDERVRLQNEISAFLKNDKAPNIIEYIVTEIMYIKRQWKNDPRGTKVLRYDTWVVEKEAELQKYLNDKKYGDYTRKIRTMHENADWIYDTQFEIVKKRYDYESKWIGLLQYLMKKKLAREKKK